MKRLIWVFTLFVSLLVIESCNKNLDTTEPIKDITKESSISIMNNMTINKIRLKDTVNNIRGELTYVRNVYKKAENIDLKPSMIFITDDLSRFTHTIKAMDYVDRKDTNYYYMSIKSIYEQDGLVSVLYEKKAHLNRTKDTLHTILTYNYDNKTKKVYTFKDIFNVDANNLNEFNKTFNTSFAIGDLDTLSFNFEKGIVWLNVNKNNTFQRFGQTRSKVKKFLIND